MGLSIMSEEIVQGIRFETTAPAIDIAIEEMHEQGLLTDVNFTVFYGGKYCTLLDLTTEALRLVTQQNISILFGPVSTAAAAVVSPILLHYDVPNILWGPAPKSEFGDKGAFPTTTFLIPTAYSFGMGLLAVCKEFQWNDIAFVYSTSPKDIVCIHIANEFELAMTSHEHRVTVNLKMMLNLNNDEYMNKVLSRIRDSVRVVFACLQNSEDMRKFMSVIHEHGMTNNEYVYISPNTYNYSGGKWNDGLDDVVEIAEKYFFFLGNIQNVNTNEIKVFNEKVLERSKLPPFNCQNCTSVSNYAYYLHDAVKFYLLRLNDILSDGSMDIDTEKLMNCSKTTFEGLTGTVEITENCDRIQQLYLLAVNPSRKLESYMTIKSGTTFYVESQTEEQAKAVWEYRGGERPLNKPICGFKNDECFHSELVWAPVKKRERAALMKLWQVSTQNLQRPKKLTESHRSLQSNALSESSVITDVDTFASGYEVYMYEGEKVFVKAHTKRIGELTKAQNLLMIGMKQLVSENLNPFVGLCLDNPLNVLSVWKYNDRGSLKDVFALKVPTNDVFFRYCLMKDLIEGIVAIHQSSFLKYHGRLTSECCLVSDRWQIRISDYGLEHMNFQEEQTNLGYKSLKVNLKIEVAELLWTAPELLRSKTTPTKASDIYSFGIICSEILTQQSAYNSLADEGDAEEIIYKIKRGRTPLTRPSLENNLIDCGQIFVRIISDCWSEDPDDRPSAGTVKALLHSVKLSNKRNLMDHMLAVLEEYAAELEDVVDQKNEEALQEKKKVDLLLYKILPKQIAEKLKFGETVEPEYYTEVTIFYSDIVSFTVLASKCTPMQVITVLNDLYTMFDSIIEEHDVYKVETIGDAYLCASGVPRRNEHNHGREIACMALAVVAQIKEFKVAHLNDEVVNVRIGIHTGPVTAGVVGLTMPRYCLFGDSVTIATKMESSGKPGKIQLSPKANDLLTKVLTGFKTEPRGEVLIQGRGVMETFWLLEADSRTTATTSG
uniref:Guanylate cyclase n=1 Tax=Syphacia muris TaxID=451379 RepID=A0A0N5AUR7_9BILA